MKKLLFVLTFLLTFGGLFAQLPSTPGTVPRASSVQPPPEDYNLSVRANFIVPRFTDTTQANTNVKLDTCGKIIYTYDVLSLWVRTCSPKRWVQIGGSIETTDNPAIDFSGNGSTSSPLTAALVLSQAAGNSAQVRADGFYVPTFISNGIVEGGDITNVPGSYTYDVVETDYVIAGVPYTAPETQLTLNNADPLLDRIDRIVVTTSNTIVVITGTPADDPQEPSYDPLTQYPLGIVLVTANTTAPNVNSEYIYLNNAEWTTASSNNTRLNPASAINPFSAPLDVDFTAAQNGDNIRFTDPSPPTTLSPTYKVLTMKVFSKATWAATSRVIMRFYSGATPVGIDVALADGIFQFNSSNTTDYQTITINLSNFGQLTTVTSILFTVSTTGANTIGLHVDNIQLQGGDGTITPVIGSFWQQGGNRWGTTGVLGTLDNFNLQLIANGTNHTMLQTGGTMWMQATNPGISFFLGTFASSDYYIQRVANTVTLNVASGAIIDHTISGNSMYNLSAANGHLFRSSSAGFQAQINASGQFLVGTNSATASNLAAFNSTTRAVRLTNQTDAQMNAIANDAGMITYNTTIGSLYYNNGAGWFPIGGAVTANNGLTMSTASNVQWRGTLNQSTTINTAGFPITFTGANGTLFSVTNTTAGGRGILVTSQGQGMEISALNNNALTAATTGASGIVSFVTTSGTQAFIGSGTFSTTNTIEYLYEVNRTTSGTAAAGLGTGIKFVLERDNGTNSGSNEILSKWTVAASGSEHSQLQILGKNVGASSTIATFDGSGVVGIGVTTSFVGSRLDVIDNTFTSGTMANFSTSSSNYASSNDGVILLNITGTTSGAIQTYGLEVIHSRTNSGANIGIISTVSNGSSGSRGVYGNAGTSGVGVYGSGSLGVVGDGTTSGGAGGEFFNDAGGEGIRASSTGGLPAQITATNSATNTTVQVVNFGLFTSGTAANGFGQSFEYNIETATSNDDAMVENIIWTTATHASRTSQYVMRLVNNAVEADVLEIAGNGAQQWGAAYQGLGVGYLSVDNSGNITWSAGSGGGGGDVVKVGTPVDNQLGVWTGNGTIEGDANLTFTGSTLTVGLAGTATGVLNLTGATSGTISIQGASASGTYTITLPTTDGNSGEFLQTNGSGVLTWATPAGAGTVTSIGLSSTDITVGGSSSPITTTGAWTLTLATVNGNVGSFGSSSTIPVITVNAKGLITAVGTSSITAPAGTLTGTTLSPSVVTSSLTAVGTLVTGTAGTGFTIGDVTMNLAGADAQGDIYYRAASGQLTRLSIGSAGQFLSVSAGLPSWVTIGAGGTVTSVGATSTSLTITGSPITTSGTFVINLNGNALGLQSVGTTGFLIRSGANTFVTQTEINAAAQLSGITPVTNGGTGLSSFTANRLLITAAGSLVQDLPTATNGIVVTISGGHMVISATFNPTVQSLSDAATIVWNVTNGGNAQVTLTGTGRTLSITNPVAGYTYTIRITQGSANRTISTWPAGTRWIGGTAPTLSTTAGAIDIITLYYDGANFYGTSGLSFSGLTMIPSMRDNIRRITSPFKQEEYSIAA